MKRQTLYSLLFAGILIGNPKPLAAFTSIDSTNAAPKKEHLFPTRFTQNKLYQMTHIAVPLLIAGGATYNAETGFRNLRDKYVPKFHYKYDDYLQYAPAALMLGLKIGGVEGRSSWGRMLTADAFSAAIMAITVNGLKYTVRKRRPDESSRNSFPSGHSATAFMTATMLHKEYGLTRSPVYSIVGYSLATATAISRQLNNRHWLSDVLFGAGLGILSTEVGYYLAGLIFKERGLRHPNLPNTDRGSRISPSFLSYGVGYAINNQTLYFQPGICARLKGGSSVSLEGAWFANRHIGVGGKIALQLTPVSIDEGRYLNAFPGYRDKVDRLAGDPMGALLAGAGPYFSWPVLPMLLVGGHCHFTYCRGAGYGAYLTWKDEPGRETNLFKVKPTSGYGGEVGLNVQKIVNDHFGLKLYGSYFLGGTVLRGTTSPDPAQAAPAKFRRHVALHSLVLGISANLLF